MLVAAPSVAERFDDVEGVIERLCELEKKAE
jgi:hypothetical protein